MLMSKKKKKKRMSSAVPWCSLWTGNVKLGCGWSLNSADIDSGPAFVVFRLILI